jgi:hypothetical protein
MTIDCAAAIKMAFVKLKAHPGRRSCQHNRCRYGEIVPRVPRFAFDSLDGHSLASSCQRRLLHPRERQIVAYHEMGHALAAAKPPRYRSGP